MCLLILSLLHFHIVIGFSFFVSVFFSTRQFLSRLPFPFLPVELSSRWYCFSIGRQPPILSFFILYAAHAGCIKESSRQGCRLPPCIIEKLKEINTNLIEKSLLPSSEEDNVGFVTRPKRTEKMLIRLGADLDCIGDHQGSLFFCQ